MRRPPGETGSLPNLARALIVLTIALAAPACTTSRGVLAYRAGALAEDKGDTTRALARYQEALEYDGKLYGAELARIRLWSQQPDRKTDAQEALDKLLKKAATEPVVAAFAAWHALAQGDVKLARARLDGARTRKPEDPADVWQAIANARAALLAAEGRWQEAGASLAEAKASPLLHATIAWNLARDDEARAQLQAAQGPHAALLKAWLARSSGDWPAVKAAVQGLEGTAKTPAVQALLAEALLHAGDAGAALAQAAEAARRDPADLYVTEIWAVCQLGGGQAAAARDLLAGLTVRGAGWSAWYHLGLAHLQLGDLAAAQQAFTAAAQRCPTCRPAVHNRDVLQRVGLRAR